jgi:polyisoprenoid-binding protein YceI
LSEPDYEERHERDHGHDRHEDDHDHDHDHGDDHDHAGHDHAGHDHTLITDRLPEGLWRVDPESSEVNFKARTLFGLVPVSGFFEGFGGELRIDAEGNAEGTLTVETGTLHTGIARRDKHLLSKDFFHAVEHPHMTFKVDGIEVSGQEHLNVTGSLSLRTSDLALSFPVFAILHGDHLHIEGQVVIDRHSVGLRWGSSGMVGRSVRADVALTLNPATE